MIVALALSPSLDVTYEVDVLHRGDITRPHRVTHVAGGKALNAARVAHALGAEVRAVAALGGHTGAWIAELLSADGVPTTVVSLARETRTCFAVVERTGGGSSTDLYDAATPLVPSEWDEFSRAAREAADAAGTWIAVSGSLPAGVPLDGLAALLRSLRARGCRVAVDSSGDGLRVLAAEADLVKVNASEAAALLDGRPTDAADAARAVAAERGIDVVVTDGVRGGFAIIGGRELALRSPASPGRFSAGSGDAFLGGLLTGLAQHDDAVSALALAVEAAERNAGVAGAGVLGGAQRQQPATR